AVNLLNLFFGAASLGFGALVPLYGQLRYSLDALSSGTLLTARAVGIICFSTICVVALRAVGTRWPMIAGFGILAVGLFGISLPPALGSPYMWLSVCAAITGVGMGVAAPATNTAALRISPDKAAMIIGVRGMFRQAGAVASVSITTAVMARSENPAAALAGS